MNLKHRFILVPSRRSLSSQQIDDALRAEVEANQEALGEAGMEAGEMGFQFQNTYLIVIQ